MEKKLRSVKKFEHHDLITDLEARLSNSRSGSDLELLLSDLGEFLKDQNNDQDQILALKKIRQRLYDKKRYLQTLENNIRSDQMNQSISRSGSNLISDQTDETRLKNFSFESIVKNKYVLVTIFRVLTYSFFSVAAMWFIFEQSVPIYSSIGFSQPEFCAMGSILLILGFSLIYSMTNSKILLLLCLYVSSYEVCLIIKGSFKNDAAIAQEKVISNPTIRWLEEKAKHSKESYEEIKGKFEDPSSRVYQNAWYKKKYLEPAWNLYSHDENMIQSEEKTLNISISNSYCITFLKIMFRLGIVLLGMASIHLLFQSISIKNKNIFN